MELFSRFIPILERKEIPQVADFIQVVKKEELATLSEDEIQKRIEAAFDYDDFKYQADNKIKLTFKDRAKGIHKILYKCPCCNDEKHMTSHENIVECTACGAKWEMDEYSRLHLTNPDKKWDANLAHVPNWYKWERKTVEEEMKIVDAYLYKAKRSGKDVACYNNTIIN